MNNNTGVSLSIYFLIFISSLFQGAMTLYYLYLSDREVSQYEISIQASIFGFGAIFGAIFGGVVGEKLTLKKVAFVISIFLIGSLLGVINFDLNHVFIFTAIFGAGMALNRSNLLVSFSGVPSIKKLEMALSWRRFLLNAGVALGAWIAGYFLEMELDLFTSFCLAILVLLLFSTFLLPRASKSKRKAKESAQSVGDSKNVYFLCLILVLALFPISLIPNLYLLHAKNNVGFSSEIAGRAFLINGLLIILVQIPVTHFLHRYSVKWRCFIAIIFIGIGISSVAIIQNELQFYFSILFWTIGEIVLFVPLLQAFIKTAPFSKGKTIGIYQLCFSFSDFIFPLVASQTLLISDTFLWTSILMVSIVSAFLALKFLPNI